MLFGPLMHPIAIRGKTVPKTVAGCYRYTYGVLCVSTEDPAHMRAGELRVTAKAGSKSRRGC
jgi:hypothetical protein